MLVLGIETSCDETGAALYDTARGLVGNRLHTQMAMHAEYGGVVPELASRDHIRRLVPLTQACLREAGADFADIDAVAYTQGPGLGGALLAGASYACGLAFSLDKPVLPVHHLEGHLLSPLLSEEKPAFPFVALLVSGGHTQFMAVRGFGDYTLLGETVDDAAGEAFDKTGKLLGLDYPAGAQLSQLARLGNPEAFRFPRPMLHSADLQMSFSGLKTAVLTAVEKTRAELALPPEASLPDAVRNDICRAFQDAVADVLAEKARRALLQTGMRRLVVAGGVGANWKLREVLSHLTLKTHPKGQPETVKTYFPPLPFCTDNGAMIAFAGAMRLLHGIQAAAPAGAFNAKPRWPLAELVRPRAPEQAETFANPQI